MTGGSSSGLTDLQLRFLQAFATRSSGFFLTGGAVLSGWVLGHRRTDDLDLFTLEDSAMSDGDRIVRSAAAEIGASVESLQSHPDFKRYLLRTEIGFVQSRHYPPPSGPNIVWAVPTLR